MRWHFWLNLTGSLFLLLLITQLLGPSNPPSADELARIRAFTHNVEFDYVTWTLDALRVKFEQIALPAKSYLAESPQHQIVLDYLDLVRAIQVAEGQLADVYTDPNIANPETQAIPLNTHLEDLYQQRRDLGPLAESILQDQLAAVLTDFGFTLGGQPMPPILYHSTPLPWALIVSPRDLIRQDANISLQTELNVEDHVSLEASIDEALGVSSLVVPVGGIGSYPTMVAQTTNLLWLAEVIAHEWIHNYLTIRPLGFRYNSSSEIRTMNETVAAIAGKDLGQSLISRFYPEFLPPPPPPTQSEDSQPLPTPQTPVFDFRAEMHITRITADQLLEAGEIEQAEAYMETRREFFWQNGYRIRKLNQAYFAFHGAYADVAGGAAGEDPVGSAVRSLLARSDSLLDFVNRMAWLTSFEQLQTLLSEPSK